jgi:hypothetical protein
MQYSFTKSITGFIPILLCTLGLILGSCGGSTGPNGGNSNGSGNGGNGIATEPTFSNVQQIFQQSCGGSGCHISETTNGVRLDTYDNVIESRGTSYGELIVQPGDASGSPLVDKIEPNPDIGSRMPENGNYLSEDRIDQIRQWINDGAENN